MFEILDGPFFFATYSMGFLAMRLLYTSKVSYAWLDLSLCVCIIQNSNYGVSLVLQILIHFKEQGLSTELYFKNKEMGETFSTIPTELLRMNFCLLFSISRQQTSILNSWLTLVLGIKEEKKKESADEAVFPCVLLFYLFS